MTKKIPTWQNIWKSKAQDILALTTSEVGNKIISYSNEKYLHWEEFRHRYKNQVDDLDVAWVAVKFSRQFGKRIPNIDNQFNPFSIKITDEQQKTLSFIDRYSGGLVLSSEPLPSGQDKENLIISGLMEEAINSSQMEGANTEKRVALEMLATQRTPKTSGEKMIMNNFIAMKRLEDWKQRELDDEFILELHSILSRDTLESKEDEGRLRIDSDDVAVVDRSTSEIVYTPPNAVEMKKHLKYFYKFANADKEQHPFVKAVIIHFWLSYIHPFVDGNGRTARALFYWSLMRDGYWMFQYIPTSPIIKKTKRQYENAFLYVETDENDLSYFLQYMLRVTKIAIDELIQHIKNKQNRREEFLKNLPVQNLSNRQLETVDLFKKKQVLVMDVETYKKRFGIAYETARRELLELADEGILFKRVKGRKFTFESGPVILRMYG
jgi:Fic family protein